MDLRHILTGTDFSDSSKGGVRESLRLAQASAARRVTLLHVTAEIKDAVALRQRMREWLQGIPEYTALDDPEGRVAVDLEQGRITSGLERCAARIGATQIIVGPLPRNFTERYLTGAIAEQLFHSTRVPVLATRAPATGGYRHVLVPMDFSDNSRRALAAAASLIRDCPGAAAPDARIELLHVASIPGGARTTQAGRSLFASMAQEFEEKMTEMARQEGVEDLVDGVRALQGVVQEAIPVEARKCGADLVCMSSSSSRGFFGSTVDAVLRNIDIPMLVAPAAPLAAG